MFYVLLTYSINQLTTNHTTQSWDLLLGGLSINFVWTLFYVLLLALLLLSVVPLLLGGLGFSYVVGANVLMFLSLSFSFWFVCWCGWVLGLLYLHVIVLYVLVLLVGFDLFVGLLRPVTLTLRVVINVTLGHTLVELFHLLSFLLLYLIMCVELFVYIIQSFVFTILIKSYSDTL